MMQRAQQQRVFLWVMLWVGVTNVLIGGFALQMLRNALRERRLPEGLSYDIGSLSGGTDEARAALETWTNFATTSTSTSGDVIARMWLIVDVSAFAVLGYGLVALATLLLALRIEDAGRTSNRLFIVAGGLGLVLAIVDVIETILTFIVIGRDGNGPATLLRWWTVLKWIVVVAVLLSVAAALVAVVFERSVGHRIGTMVSGAQVMRGWARRFVWAALALAVSILALVILADRDAHPVSIFVVGILFAVAAFRFNAALEARRAQDDTDRVFVYLRLTFGAELVVIGLCLTVAWMFGSPPAGVGFIGLVATLFGASGLLNEFRWSHSRARKVIAIGLVAGAGVVGMAALLVPSPFVGIAMLFVAIFVLGMIGLSSVTEDVLRHLVGVGHGEGGWPASKHGWLLPSVGVVLVIVAAVWALVDDWTGRNLVFGALVLVVFALVLGSNWSSEAFIAVGAVVVIWALSPSVSQITETITPVSGDEVMVVLGDSYTSGEGGSTFFEGTNTSRAEVENKCRRSAKAYGVRLAENPADPVPSRIVFVACSGATFAKITTDPQYVGEPRNGDQEVERDGAESRGLNQLEHVDWVDDKVGGTLDISTVLVGTGGNDAGFADVVALCVLPGDCSELAEQWINDLQVLRPALEDTFRTIREHFGDDVVYVAMPYPVPIGPTACGESHYTVGEHRFLFNYVTALNLAVTEAAANTGFHVVEDVKEAFTAGGNGICTGETPGDLAINYLAAGQEGGVFEDQLNPTNWLHNSMHPNDDGHALVAAAAADWFIREAPVAMPAPAPGGTGTPLTIEGLIGRTDDYCSDDPTVVEPSECNHRGYTWAAAQALESVRRHTVLALVGFVGIWLVVLRLLLLWRTRRTIASA